jgi:vancomycin resistance protein YoaR
MVSVRSRSSVSRWKSIALSLAAGTALGLLSLPYVEPRLPASPTLVGLRVGGEELPRGSDVRAWIEERARAFRDRRVVLRHGKHRFETTLAELGASIDVDATIERVHDAGHSGSVVKRLRETAAARRGALDLKFAHRLDEQVAAALVRGFSDELALEPVDAELDMVAHRRVPDRPGQELDVAASVLSIGETFATEPELNLVTRSIPAKVTLADLSDIDVTKVLAAYETHFQPWKVGRSQNVALATKLLNGLIIRKGETVSFNQRVGPRTQARGFQLAPEIVGDELTTGIGGGTCQVSSTLHAAALYGGLEILERRSHSRPADYTKLGLDATVKYPQVDLTLRNPFPFALVVHATLPEEGVLRVELLGGEAVNRVEYRYGVSRIESYVRRITTKSFLKPGKAYRHQRGTRGMDVHSYVTIMFKDGRVEERRFYSGYKSTPEVYWVAPGYDEAELPPLPEHARGVEGRLTEDGSETYYDMPTTG